MITANRCNSISYNLLDERGLTVAECLQHTNGKWVAHHDDGTPLKQYGAHETPELVAAEMTRLIVKKSS